MSRQYTDEHLASVANDPAPLIDRLRGDYGIRSFDTPPIQHVAANALAAKDAEIERLKAAHDQLAEECDTALVEMRRKDSRISSLEADCALLGAVYEHARRYVYGSSRFEPDNTFQAKLKQAVDDTIASPTASAWVKGTQ